MPTEQELKNTNPQHKEFQNLLEKDFKDRKLKENEIIKATVTEITKNFTSENGKILVDISLPSIQQFLFFLEKLTWYFFKISRTLFFRNNRTKFRNIWSMKFNFF